MPEGDTIHRTAETLRGVLLGRVVTRFEAPRLPRVPRLEGSTITKVEARGKHLLVRFSTGVTLHTHQKMTGSWHVYRHGERWRRQRTSARVVIGVAQAVAVCFQAPVVELLDDGAMARHPSLRRLGPDLCDPDVDLDAATVRMAGLDDTTLLADALLDQRVACGIGNVYKSEVCFLHGIHPATALGAVDDPQRRDLLTTAGELLRANLAGSRRTTVSGARPGTLYVYGRGGRPCRRCATPIVTAPLGAWSRTTSWCPRCQPQQCTTRSGRGVRSGPAARS